MQKSDFPKLFSWGAATAAYQIEGAAAVDGRGPSIWDTFSHLPGKTRDGDTGDTACDHYHRFKEDIALMKSLGLSDYRFSISWSRVLPRGEGPLNPLGVEFYDKLIDELLANGIRPSVTLYHWDLPQALQDKGGWPSRSTVDAFVEYARAMFSLFGHKVDRWYTHNEPWVVAWAGHFQGRHAPGISDAQATVDTVHNLLLSHALAVDTYKKHPKGHGEIGIVLNLYPVIPAQDTPEDRAAATLADCIHNRSFLDPLYLGDYPRDYYDHLAKHHLSPKVEAQDLATIAGNPGDFLGVNYYFRKIIAHSTSAPALVPYEEFKPQGAWYTSMNWEVYPQGLTELLLSLKETYHNPAILITECGAAFEDQPGPSIADPERRQFLEEHFKAALDSIKAGVRLKGFYVWSLMDNFEWAQGYARRFGIIGVDYQSQKRTLKESARWLQDFLKE